MSNVAPNADSRSVSVAVVSSGAIGSVAVASTGPASIASFISMSETPVTVSPASSAALTGEAPRCRGKSDACTLSAPRGGMARTAGGRILPYAATSSRSGATRRSHAANRGRRTLTGWTTSTPARAACDLHRRLLKTPARGRPAGPAA